MENLYILSAFPRGKRTLLYSQTFANKDAAFETYHEMCEEFVDQDFKVTKRQTIDLVVAESDDYRQQRFSF